MYDANGAVSASFAYGVSLYYARMNNQNAALTNLVNAMMVLYETTLCHHSCLVPEAGEMMVKKLLEMQP